jgi:hypothetical protein
MAVGGRHPLEASAGSSKAARLAIRDVRMSSFRMGAVVFLVALSINAHAAETPADAEKHNREFLRLTAENAELKKKVKELDLAKADCIQVLQQYSRAAKDD